MLNLERGDFSVMMNYLVVKDSAPRKLIAISDRSFTQEDLNEMIKKEFPGVDPNDIIVARSDTVSYVMINPK